jgi:non-ribosomal peptide synthetase component F
MVRNAALAAALGVVVLGAAPLGAQQASNGGAGLQAYQAAEERLTAAHRALQGQGAGQAEITQAREAVVATQQSLTQAPDNLRSTRGYERLNRELAEAQGYLVNGQPDVQGARRELEQVIATTSVFRAEAGMQTSHPGGDPAAGSTGLQRRSLGGQAPAAADAQTGGSGGTMPGASGGRQ